MKLTLLFLLFLIFTLACAAQDACRLETNNAPALHNLRLGMSPEQVQSVFGRDLKIKIKKKGERTFFQNFIEKSSPASIPGVRALYLRFFDLKLYQIEIFYEDKPEWRTLESFVGDLSVKWNLSSSFWHENRGRRELICDGFSLRAAKVLNPSVEITDEQTRIRVEELRQQKSKKD